MANETGGRQRLDQSPNSRPFATVDGSLEHIQMAFEGLTHSGAMLVSLHLWHSL